MLRVEKRIIIISSGGAAVTMIDGRSVDVIQNVFLTSPTGGEFGRPGKGFTVTETAQRDGSGDFLGDGIVGSTQVTGNAGNANVVAGIYVRATSAFTGSVTKNNFFANDGSRNCGLINGGVVGLRASNNYWGAASGPGAPPANSVCHPFGGTTTISPFATTPFAVKPLKP